MSLVVLETFYNFIEAEIVRGRLLAGGIDAVILDGAVSATYGGSLPVRLMVLEEDCAAARTLLEEKSRAVDTGPWGDLQE